MINTYHNLKPHLLGDLRELILQLCKAGLASYPTMNVGGWKTDEAFFETPHPAVQELRRWVEEVFGLKKLSGWAMVNGAGSYHQRHQHTNVVLTGVYYVDPGEPPTPTVFEASVWGSEKWPIVPEPGMLVTFPEGMWHSVPVYTGFRPRITIVLNAKREDNS
jgi:hypothetical protein